MRKNKRFAFSDIMRQKLLLDRNANIEQISEDILYKKYESELRKEYPNAKQAELKKIIKDRYTKEYNELTSQAVAPLYHDRVNDIIKLSQDSVIIGNTKSYNHVEKFKENTQLPDIYKKIDLKTNLFDAIEQFGAKFNSTAKKQTGAALINNVIKFDKINYSHTKVKAAQTLDTANKAYNFFQKADKFLAYDLETLGGTDEYGYKKVDALIEFAYGIYDKKLGADLEKQTIVGLSREQEKAYRALLKDIDKTGAISGEQEVIFHRIGLYGHKDTLIEKGANGMYSVKSMAELEKGYRFSQKEIDEGFKRLTRIYEEQNAIQTTSGLTRWQEEFADMLGHMNNKKLSVVDYNGTIADRPWINKFLGDLNLNAEQKATFLKRAGMPDMFLDSYNERFLDVRAFTRFAGDNVGPTALYKSDHAKEILKSFTPYSQEGLTRGLLPELYNGSAAHTAGFDSQLLANLVANKKVTGFEEGMSVLDMLHRDANLKQSSLGSTIRTGNLDLFMANESVNFWKGGSNPLSYVYDPMNKTYRMANQMSVGADGVAREITRESPIKRGRLYTVDFAGEVDMTEDWIKNMSGLHDEYAQKKLYALKLNPVSNRVKAGAHQGLQGHSVLLFNSKDQMEATMSNLLKIGERQDSSSKFEFLKGKAGEEVKEALSMHRLVNGKVQNHGMPISMDHFIELATKADVNETSARMVRDDSLKKALNFNSFYNKLLEYTGEEEVTAKQANALMLEMMQKNDRTLSRTVASGKKVSLSFQDVQQALGYSLDGGESYKLISNTFNNQMGAFEYMKSQIPVMKEIADYLSENGMDIYSSGAAAQYKFENILSGLTERVIAEATNNEEVAKRLWHNTQPRFVMGKDLNYFNFNIQGMFMQGDERPFNTFNKPTIDEDILRISLDPGKEYKLVDTLIRKNRYGSKELTAFQRNAEGITQLHNFVTQIKDSGQYKGIFADLNEETMSGFTRADVFGHSVIQSLRKYREQNPTAGYTDAYWQDATVQNRVLNVLASDKDKLKAMIKDIDRQLPNYVQVNGDANQIQSYVKDLMKNVLVDQVDINSYAKQYGFNGAQAKHMNYVYNQAQKEYEGFLTDFVSAFTQAKDVNFMYDKKSGTTVLTQNGKYVELNLPKIKALDGSIFVDTGSSKVALHAKLSGGRSLTSGKYNPENVKMITTLGDAINESQKYINVFKVAKKGEALGETLHRSTSVMQNFMQQLRQGASIDYNDILDVQAQFRVDYSDIMALAPMMKEAGVLNGRNWRDKDFLKRMKTGLSWATSNDADREMLQKNIPELMRIIAEQKGGFNDDTWIGMTAKNLSFLGKETQVADGIGMIDGIVHRAGAQFNNNSRPVINQARSILYRTSEWEKAIAKNKGRHITLNPVTTSDASKALFNRSITGLGKDNRTSIELYTGKANISEVGYRSAISEHFLRQNHLTARQQKVYEQLKGINLTEQEQVMDSRLADDFFSRMQEQKINNRKQLSFYMDINQSTIQEADDLRNMTGKFSIDSSGNIHFNYGKGVYKERHDKLFSIQGYESNYVQGSKITGKFNQGYFTKTDGMLVTESEINELLQQSGINFKGMSKDEAIQKANSYLDEILDKAFYVKPTDQLGYKKILQGQVEKGMGYIPYFGLGKLDENVAGYIGQIDKSLLGRVKTMEYIQDEIVDKFDKSIGAKFGIKSKEQLSELILAERHEAFDTLRQIFGDDSQDFAIISNHIQGKHGNRQLAFEELAATMRKRLMDHGYSEREAMDKVFSDLAPHMKGMNITQDAATGALKYENTIAGGKAHYDLAGIRGMLKGDKLYEGIEDGLELKANGKTIGSYAVTSLTESRDFQWLSGHTDTELIDSFARLDEKIAKATGAEKTFLEQQRKNLEMAYDYNTKGQKITDRELQMLNLQTYDDNIVEMMQRNLSKEEFERTMGHVIKRDQYGNMIKNDKGVYELTDLAKGRSMLSEYTGSLKQKFLTGNGEKLTLNSDLDKMYSNEHVRKGIHSLIEANNGELAKNTAENLYSLGRGVKAMQFNTNNLSLEAMLNEGFEVKRFDEIYNTFNQGKMSLEHPDSIFNKNLIIDFGQDFNLSSERYVALPFAPTTLTGDTVVRKNFQKQLASTMRSAQRVQDFGVDDVEEGLTKQQLISRFNASREELLKQIDLYSISGKDGAAGQFSIRLDQSVVGKASSVVVLDPDKTTEGITEVLSDAWKRSLVKHQGDKVQALAEINYSPMSKAKFMGTSLVEHYANERYVNASFASLDIFEEMGVFSEKFYKARGFESKQALIDHLETEGIMVNAIRTPSIKTGSTSPSMMYLDKDLHGKRIKTLFEQQLARTEDNDGDQPSFSVLQINDQDSLMAKHTGAINDAAWRDMDANIMTRAVGENRYWHDTIYGAGGTLEKDLKNARNNANFFTLAGDSAIDQKIFAEFNVNPLSEDIKKQHQILTDFKKEFAQVYAPSYNGPIEDFALDLGSREVLDQVDELIAGMSDRSLASAYQDAVIFDNAFMRTEVGAIAKVRKNAIGEANTALYKLRKAADLALPKYGDDSNLRHVLQTTFETIEQEVISSKKGNVRDYVTKVEDFKGFLNNVISGSAESQDNARREMYDWMQTHVKKDFVENGQRLKAMGNYIPSGMSADEEFDYIARNTIDALSSFNTYELNMLKGQEAIGTALRSMGVSNPNSKLGYISNDTTSFKNMGLSLLHESGQLSSNVLDVADIQRSTQDKLIAASEYVLRDGNDALDLASSSASSNVVKQIAGEAGEALSRGIQDLTGSKLGIAAMGLAAAYMITGFVGNNASAPADHAPQMAENENPSFSDAPQMYQQSHGSSPNGYVINMRGSGSPASINRAQRAINQSMSQMVGNDLNVRMNIIETDGNINDRYLDELLINAIGR